MRQADRLEVAAGFATACGPRPDNQDFGGVDPGSATDQILQGIVAAVADGVGGAMAGRVAAELAVRSFIDGYRAQNPLIGVPAAAARAIGGYNRWLHERGRIDPAMAGAATTFAALVLRGREAVALHVGDSRAWHLRGAALTRLTEDHVLPQPDLNHVLYRAVGIEADVRLDVRRRPLEVHDRLLLTTDGVHGALRPAALARLLVARGSPQADAEAIVAAATAAGTRDNATAIVIDIVRLPAIDADMIAAEAGRLPILPPPRPGDVVDGFRLDRVLADGRYARVFAADDGGRAVVLKFPKPALLSEAGARAGFLREAFVGRRIDSPFVGATLALAANRQSRLYIAMPFHAGETLEARLVRQPPSIAAGIAIAVKLARGLATLHRLGIAHRDVKPENVILTTGGGLKLVDLGVARLAHLPDFTAAEMPGTPSYLAPELYGGAPGDARSDQFALGVTLYRMFTGRYPYGEVEAFSRPTFGQPVPPTRHRPDMPAWLESALLRLLAHDPADRFADMDELIHRLEAGSSRAAPRRPRAPLVERDPARFWRRVAGFLAVALLLSLLAHARAITRGTRPETVAAGRSAGSFAPSAHAIPPVPAMSRRHEKSRFPAHREAGTGQRLCC